MATHANTLSTPNRSTDDYADSCVGRGLTTPEVHTEQESFCEDSKAQCLKRYMCDRFQILRSTPFRLGMMFWLLFTLCFGLGLFVFYQSLQERLLNRIDASISEHFDSTEKMYSKYGLESVIELTGATSSSPMATAMGFYLSTPEGIRLAGNVPVSATAMGWNIVSGENIGLENDSSSYRFLTRELGGNVLSVGRSLDDLMELRSIALNCVLWMLAISTVLALGVAWLFSQRIQERISHISDALSKVASGNLVVRLPVSSADDDIDVLSGQINTSLDRLKHTVDGMRQVSTDIAHDLKTPLNRLFITIDDAATKSRAGQCVGNDLDGALKEAQAINGTFEALLRIAQIEAGAKKSQFKTLDLKDVLETAAEVYLPVIEENGQHLDVDLQSGGNGHSLPLFGDRNLLLQLVVNIIENSVNHCAPGTRLRIAGGEDEGMVWLQIADTGLGIPANEREKVFQRLYRLERSRTTQGTGLGLSMVKAIADLHCGTLYLDDNKPGLVTTIRFSNNRPAE